MRKITIIVMSLLLLLSGIALAADQEVITEPSIVVLVPNHLRHTPATRNSELKQLTINNINKTFSKGYKITISDEYIKKMADAGFTDSTTMERSDIMEFFKGTPYDYVIIYDLLPTQEASEMIYFQSRVTYVHLKIIDVKGNKYLYNGKLSYKSNWASLEGHINKMYSDAEIIFNKYLGTPINSKK